MSYMWQGRNGPDDAYDEDEQPGRYTDREKACRDSEADKRGRKENGLVELTKKFIDLLKEAENQTIDLNEAVKTLDV